MLSLVACKKEQAERFLINEDDPALKVMNQANAEFAAISSEKYVTRANNARANLYEFRTLATKTQQQNEVPLTELFYIYEGIFNYANVDELLHEPTRIEETFICEINYDQNQQAWYLSMQELSDLLNEIDQMIDVNVDENSEFTSIVDLTLESISGNSATIRVRLIKGPLPQSGSVFLTPANPVWAAQKLGDCNLSNGGNDGADFLGAYANAQAPHNQLVCPPGTQKFIVVTYTSDTRTVLDFTYQAAQYYSVPIASSSQLWNYYTQQIMPKSWYGQTNQCIGFDNQEWYGRYANMDFLIQAQLSYAVYLNPSAQFIVTDYKSYGGRFSPLPLNSNYHHGGTFYYGVVYCN